MHDSPPEGIISPSVEREPTEAGLMMFCNGVRPTTGKGPQGESLDGTGANALGKGDVNSEATNMAGAEGQAVTVHRQETKVQLNVCELMRSTCAVLHLVHCSY